ncbi:MAG: tRNA1(Val) (adenine(37)-N6)-methyltransferase [Gemmiger sp.]
MHCEILDNGTRVYTAPGATFGTDALLLARFAQPRENDRALDLCSGCGIVALAWHDAGHRGPCAAVELDAGASALCAAAVAEQPEAGHIQPVCGDLRTLFNDGPAQGRYDFAACNPPYFTAGPRSPDPRRAAARHDGSCTLADVAACAARALHDGGKLILCHRPDQMAEVFCTLRGHRLEPKRVALVKNRTAAAPWLFLVEAQKNRRPGLQWLPDVCIDAGSGLYGAAR